MNKGLDVGTNRFVLAYTDEQNNTVFNMQRDAYYTIQPKTAISKMTIKKSFDKRGIRYIEEGDSIIIIGEAARDVAIERNDTVSRPLIKGVISPKDKNSLPMIKAILKSMLGNENADGTVLVYSVPGNPVNDNFDIIYHKEILNMFFSELGYKPKAINEAYAIALSELVDYDLSGISCSTGAGMCNICVVNNGDPIIDFSVTIGGDFIDNSVATALDLSPSLVQMEKENGTNLDSPSNKIIETVGIYYKVVVKNIIDNLVYEIKKNKSKFPSFRKGIPIAVAGGLANASGFKKLFKDTINSVDFPIEIEDVYVAENPDYTVANGCLIAASL